MGKRYTKDEISQIQMLSGEGLTLRDIASQLGRPEAGIRNIRYRVKMKTSRRESINQLSAERQALSQQVYRVGGELWGLESRKGDIDKALKVDEATLNTRLMTALRKLKDTRPDLFEITLEEQLGKMAAELTGTLLKYLIE
ncbi:MAG: hypothetical protein QGF78_07440 [Candidatus Bathyarchaeota archaeon]|nr:hypothetical protein [Candidatus Bathyarchaeota archaeon]